jgi:N-acetylglucosamine-6-phosphate deacetylase
MISPGLVDLQVNGFAGVDFNSGAITAAELDRALEAMLATGVTICLPTIITAFPDELAGRLATLDAAVAASRLGRSMCPGYHLEGPFLNPGPGYHGCHPPQAMTAADPGLIARLEAKLERPILMVTLAPEIDGALALTRKLAGEGRIVALGHTAADFAQVEAAAKAGATLSTHLGNGLPQSLHKLANPLFAQLSEDRLAASFIADGIHLDPRALKAMIRAKGFERAILVTDAVAGAAAKPGAYTLGSLAIERHGDGSVRLAGSSSLAGAALCLDEAVRNVVAWGLADAAGALAMASTHPLAAITPALSAFKIVLPESEVEWSPDLRVRGVRVGATERRFDTSMTV